MSNAKRSKFGCLVAFALWMIAATVIAVGWRYVVQPMLNDELTSETSAARHYDHDLTIALDSFSGYALWRSPELARDLARDGIRLKPEDDGADYAARLRALKNGDAEFAVFTIDALLAAGADNSGEFPASIVMVIDETKGADAVVANPDRVTSITDLNDPQAQIVVTKNSPSEFLARVMVAHFNLPALGDDWLLGVDSVEEVYKQFDRDTGTRPQAYVLWEPYVAQATRRNNAAVLIDSSRLKGFIVDVLVVERKFLRDHLDIVQRVIEGYLRAAYNGQSASGGMTSLVSDDAQRLGAPLKPDEAQAVVDGIAWANTVDNYTYFGIGGHQNRSIRHIEDSIRMISDVLVSTKRVSKNPTNGRPESIYFDGVLKQLHQNDFHPAIAAGGLNIIETDASMAATEQARAETTLSELGPSQWAQLRPIGELRVAPIAFGRGGARLTVQAERDLKALAQTLDAWPETYCQIRGHTREEGDADANRRLAGLRAEAVRDFLLQAGVAANRLGVQSAPGDGGQAVSFILGTPAY